MGSRHARLLPADVMVAVGGGNALGEAVGPAEASADGDALAGGDMVGLGLGAFSEVAPPWHAASATITRSTTPRTLPKRRPTTPVITADLPTANDDGLRNTTSSNLDCLRVCAGDDAKGSVDVKPHAAASEPDAMAVGCSNAPGPVRDERP